jgi:hypothetical protein
MKISTPTMCYSTTKKLWDNVYQMYSDLGNQSQVYDLTLKLGDIRPGENSHQILQHTKTIVERPQFFQ